jgi:pSer/pThr/pTyr-binding forkhead associated (FHA) protein
MAKILIQLPTGNIDHALTEEVVTIGRAPDNTLVIDDVSVSSYHAQLTPDGEAYIFEDLGSTNGSRINGKTAAQGEKNLLRAGDKVRLGRVDAVYDPDNVVEGEAREMPDAVEPTLESAARSVKPSNFLNASPFSKKAAEKDPVGKAALAIAAVAVLASIVAAVLALQLNS